MCGILETSTFVIVIVLGHVTSQELGLSGNPLQPDILSMISEVNGISKLLSFLLDNLTVPPRPPEREWIQLLPPNQQHSKCK